MLKATETEAGEKACTYTVPEDAGSGALRKTRLVPLPA